MIHRGDHRLDYRAVGECEHRYLGALEELLDDDAVAALTELALLHNGANGVGGLLTLHGDDNALAECETVRLDNNGDGTLGNIFICILRRLKDLVGRGGNAVLLHKILGEDLASLDLCRRGTRAEAGHADSLKSVNATEHQRIVGSDYRVVDLVLRRELNDRINILCTDGNESGVLCHTAVAGEGKDLFDRLVLTELLYDGVLSAATAYYHYFHLVLLWGIYLLFFREKKQKNF